MAKKAIDVLKSYFETGDQPTQQQFADLIDSFFHKDGTINIENITGLTEILQGLENIQISDVQGLQAVLDDLANIQISDVQGLQSVLDSLQTREISDITGLTSALTDITERLTTIEENYVPKDGDKQLSTEDFTTEYKAILDGGIGIPEAPNDGQQYSRMNLGWSVVGEVSAQTFDEVLETGNQAEGKSFRLNSNDGIGNSYLHADKNGVQIFKYDTPRSAVYSDGGMTHIDESGNRAQLNAGYLSFKNGGNEEETVFNPAYYGENTFYIPVSVDGNLADSSGNITTGYGTPNLQEVIEEGGNALLGNVDFTQFAQFYMAYEPDAPTIALGVKNGDDAVDFGLDNGIFHMKQSSGTNYSQLTFESPVSEVNIKIPAKETLFEEDEVTEIPYILATTADVTMQKMINNGAVASKGGSGAEIMTGGDINNLLTFFALSNNLTGEDFKYSEISQRNNSVSLSVAKSDTFASESRLDVGENGISLKYKKNGNKTELIFSEPVFSGGEVFLPAPTDTRGYKISYAEVFTNTTDTALSASALDSVYTQAKIGDKINCLNITTGALQYEKTASGWISHIVTVVV